MPPVARPTLARTVAWLLAYGLAMEERPGYWQQQYANARPPAALFWCAAHRRLVRFVLALPVASAVGLLIRAALDDGRIVSPIINILGLSSQFVLWGFAAPRQVDEWQERQAAREQPSES